MWGRKRQSAEQSVTGEAVAAEKPRQLRDALRQARIESAERTGVVVDLHDAEVARLELLNDELVPLFEELPQGVELFDRGISRGETPRLWIDVVAHIHMGRDKRVYRFVQDTRFGRKVLAETAQMDNMVEAVARYLAQRLVERERVLADSSAPLGETRYERRRRRWRAVIAFLFGVFAGVFALVAAAWLIAARGL
jgi:hypothetical protein